VVVEALQLTADQLAGMPEHILGSGMYTDRVRSLLGHDERTKYELLYCTKTNGWLEPTSVWGNYVVPAHSHHLVVVFQAHDGSKTVGGVMPTPRFVDSLDGARYVSMHW
jgi:hypothetical protein